MLEEEMMDIADFIHAALSNGDDPAKIAKIRDQVRQLTRRFPLPG
jgi:glycine hydroxymethyltransferase